MEEATARPEDVSTLDGILHAFYDVISGPAGQPRDWDRDRSLYHPGAILVPTTTLAKDHSPPVAHVLDVEGYKKRSNDYLMEGFFEREIHRITRKFGNLAHVFSTYEARRTPDGPVFRRGVNSIELFFDGKRWWIIAAVWDSEREGNPIPPEFLPHQ
jgi:hypothetical protein